MSDSFGKAVSDIGFELGNALGGLPKSIVTDAKDQVMGDDGQKAIEQGQSDDKGGAQNLHNNVQNKGAGQVGDLQTIQKQQQAQARIAQIRNNLSQIEHDVEMERQKREQREQERDEQWDQQMQYEEQVKQQQTQKAQSRIEEMLMRERSGAGETGKRTG